MKKHPLLYIGVALLVVLVIASGFTLAKQIKIKNQEKEKVRILAEQKRQLEEQNANAMISAKDLSNKIIDQLNQQKQATLTITY